MNELTVNKKVLLCFSLCSVMTLSMMSGLGKADPITKSPEPTQETKPGLEVASGGLTLLYFPVKAAYAGLGGIVGGIAYVLGGGDLETAQAVWEPTMYGTYVITPDHLEGKKPVQFFGHKATTPKPEEQIGMQGPSAIADFKG